MTDRYKKLDFDCKKNGVKKDCKFALMTYHEPKDFEILFPLCRHYCYIFHNKDKTITADDKIPHYHIILKLYNECNPAKLLELLPDTQNTFIQNIKNDFNIFNYLTHSNYFYYEENDNAT